MPLTMAQIPTSNTLPYAVTLYNGPDDDHGVATIAKQDSKVLDVTFDRLTVDSAQPPGKKYVQTPNAPVTVNPPRTASIEPHTVPGRPPEYRVVTVDADQQRHFYDFS